MTRNPRSGAPFPLQTVPRLGGGDLVLGKPLEGRDWQLIVVYRGLHCPICKKYIARLDGLAGQFHEIGVDVVTASGDPEEKARAFAEETGANLPVGHSMTTAQMQALGLYISAPRSERETDRPFPEPGTFVVNAEGALHLVDISNAPFARPDLEALLGGLRFIRNNDYPIRGTWAG